MGGQERFCRIHNLTQFENVEPVAGQAGGNGFAVNNIGVIIHVKVGSVDSEVPRSDACVQLFIQIQLLTDRNNLKGQIGCTGIMGARNIHFGEVHTARKL